MSRPARSLAGVLGTFAIAASGLAQPLAEWTVTDIGPEPVTARAAIAGDCLEVTTTGGSLDLREDSGTFIHRALEGDGAIETRLASLEHDGPGTLHVALALRGSLDPGSRFVACAANFRGRWAPWLPSRDRDRGEAGEERIVEIPASEWLAPPDMVLRLERRGELVSALVSLDGSRWLLVGEHRLPAPLPVRLLAGVLISTEDATLVSRICDLRLETASTLLAPGWRASPSPAFAGREVVLEAEPGAGMAGEGSRFEWDFGDGAARAEGALVRHVYAETGEYVTELRVRDPRGREVLRRDRLLVLREPKVVGDWTRVDLFGAGPSEAVSRDGCLEVTARGTRELPASDRSTYVFKTLRGDFRLRARATEVRDFLGSAPAYGLMARESLDPRSREVHLDLVHPEGDLTFRPNVLARTAWDAGETLVVQSSLSFPPAALPGVWLELTRTGGAIIGSYSRDAVTWRELGRVELELPWQETLLVGLAVTATCGVEPVCPTPFGVTFCDVTLAGEVVASEPRFRRGDVDSSGRVNLTDAVFAFNRLFRGGPAPDCEDAADADDDGKVDVTDVLLILDYLFRGGVGPVAPGPIHCGTDDDVTDGLIACAAPCP